MRKWFTLTLTALALLVTSTVSQAQSWPAQPITLINGFPPGGGADILARLFAERLRDALGQPVTVENRTGANGLIAAGTVAAARPDGYTLLLQTMSIAATSVVMPGVTLNFNPDRDLAQSVIIAGLDNLLYVSAKTPFTTVQQVIDYARANPDKLTYGSSGVGSSYQLWAAQFTNMAGIRMVHVLPAEILRLPRDLQANWIDGAGLGRNFDNGGFVMMCANGSAASSVYDTVRGNSRNAVGAACTAMMHTILTNPPPFPEMDSDDVFRAILSRRRIPREVINAQTLRDSFINSVNDPNNAGRTRASVQVRGTDGRDYSFNINGGVAAYVSAIQPPRNAGGPIPDYASIIQEASRCFRVVSADADPTIGHCVNSVGTPLARRARQEGPVYSTVR